MRNWVLAILLVSASPPLLAASDQVETVLKTLDAHGFVSPMRAAARLQTALDAQGAPLSVQQHRRYYAVLIELSVVDRNAKRLERTLDQLQRLVKNQHCAPCQATWLLGKAQQEITQRHLPQARDYLKQAAALTPAHDERMQLELATAQIREERAQGVLDMAYKHAMQALPLAEHLEDQASHVRLTINLAVFEAQLGYVDRALKTINDAVAQAKAIGFTAALAEAYLDLGYIHGRRKQRPQELEALTQSLAISTNTPGLDYIKVVASGNLADYYLNENNYAAALKQATRAAELARAEHDGYAESIGVANIGIAQSHLGHVGDGIASLRKALALAQQSGYPQVQVTLNRELVKALKAAGRYKDALDALQAMDDVNAKITEQERDNAVLELQAKYDDERKNREIEKLSTQARLKDAEASARLWQQRLWTTLGAAAVAAALLMVLWVGRAWRANRRLSKDVADLTEQSSVDALTGVFNRRHFATLMNPYAGKDRTQVGLVMLDIDHFKHVNDTFGHDAGDVVLAEVARRLQAFARTHDHVVRWGGEEFVLVLHNAAPQGLAAMATRLLDTVATSPIAIGRQNIHVTVSAGCVVHPLTPTCPWDRALRLADTAMYRAKHRGRNRATCVLAVNAPLSGDADEDFAKAMQSDAIGVTEVTGPAVTTPATID